MNSSALIQNEVFGITCYFRHLQEVFRKASIEVTGENKRDIEKVIHGIVGTKYKDCPETRKEVKKRIANDEAGFVLELKKAWNVRVSPQ